MSLYAKLTYNQLKSHFNSFSSDFPFRNTFVTTKLKGNVACAVKEIFMLPEAWLVDT